MARHGKDTADREATAQAGGERDDAGTPRSSRWWPAVRRGARAGWRTVAVGRAWVAKLVMTAALLVALVLGLGALAVGFGANEHNVLVSALVSAGRWLDGPFGDLFTFPDHVKQLLVNWVIAAVAYLALGGILSRLIRP